jgi:hypothetical protein
MRLMRTARTALIFALAALAFPAAASASTGKQYVLKHPKHEHCRAHYVKRVEQVKVHGRRVKETFCVYQAPKPAPTLAPMPTTTDLIVTHNVFAFATPPNYFTVEAQIVAGPLLTAKLPGEPVAVTITDTRTGQTVGSFGVISNAPGCAVVETYNQASTERIYTGEPVGPNPACALPRVGVPAVDLAQITGAYSGRPGYAPSVSKQEYF